MKKVLMIFAVASIGLVSCKKEYQCCDYSGMEGQCSTYDDLEDEELSDYETACTNQGGSWSQL